MNEDTIKTITEENLTINELSEYIHNAVGEASTLFYRNEERVFDGEAARELAERLLVGIRKLIEEAKSTPTGDTN